MIVIEIIEFERLLLVARGCEKPQGGSIHDLPSPLDRSEVNMFHRSTKTEAQNRFSQTQEVCHVQTWAIIPAMNRGIPSH